MRISLTFFYKFDLDYVIDIHLNDEILHKDLNKQSKFI